MKTTHLTPFSRRLMVRGLQVTALALMGLLAGSASAQSASTTLTTNWNKTPGGDTLWMSSIFKTTSTVSDGQSFFFDNVTASFPFNGPTQNVTLPNAEITFSSNFSSESSTYNSATNTWVTDVPLSDAGKNIFLTGVGWQVPAPGIQNNISGNQVSLTGDFSSTKAGAIQWQWSAAAYNNFSTDPNALGVQTVDGNGLHAGTPDNFADASNVDQGGSGGGASNFTGSYSPTASVSVPAVVPEPSSALLFCLGALVMIRRARRVTTLRV